MKDASNTKPQLINEISLLKKRIQELEQSESDRPSAEQAGKLSNKPLAASEESLKERLRFEALLFDLSARFMATPFDQVDSEIDNALRQIMEFFQVVLCGLLEVKEDKTFVRVSHAVYGEGVEPVSGEINLVELYPWTYGRLMQGKHININGVEDYPEEALRDRESYAAMGTGSRLAIPVAVGGRILRIITIHQKHRHQTWPEEYIPRLRLLGEILVNALERRQGRLQLEEQLRFEMLLAEISGHFVNLPADRIDGEIEEAQRRICELLSLDILAIWQWSDEAPGFFTLTHFFSAREIQQPSRRLNEDDFPWFQQQMLAGRIVAVSSLEELPAEAAHDREVCRQIGIKSNLCLPLSVGGEPPVGILGLNTTRMERDWPEALVKGLQLVAQVFTNAFARKRAEQALKDNEEINRATFEQAAVGIAHVGIDGRWLRVNDKLCSIVGYPREELLRMTFQDITQPDDLETDMGYMRQVLSGKIKTYSMEKRYFRKDRSIVWVNLTVSLVLTATGKPRHFISVVEDITERKRAELSLEERLHFERLLSDLSAAFVKIPPDRVDSEIEYGLGQILEFFRVDRCALLLVLPEKTSWQITHVASLDGVLPVPAGVELPRSIFPWIFDKLVEKHEALSVPSLDDLPDEAAVDKQTCIEWGIRSFVNIPILIGESVGHIININLAKDVRVWHEELIPRLQLLGEIFVNALEIRELKLRLERENIYLQEEIKLLVEHTGIVGQSRAMRKVLAQAEQVARTDSTVLLQGETGTGKELLARAIHQMSSRKNRPLVTVNCASLPPTLIESELFGRERGAYTGAMTKMVGRFEIADGSTIFLDEIGELPLELQSKLLRVIEEGSFERLGSTKPLHVNVRIIAASNRDIEQEVKDGTFRRDLFYRLNVFPIVVPPLRERPEDIPLMVWAFVNEFQKRMGKEIESVSRTTLESLQSYSWPGNVRELRNVIERAMILNSSKTLVIQMPRLESSKIQTNLDLEDMERRHIVSVLESTGWRVSGKGAAAEVLGLKRSTLISKMTKLGISRPTL